jgi:hypothetical protein
MLFLRLKNRFCQHQIGLFLFIFLSFAFHSNSQTTTVFTTPGANTWVCPAGVTSIQVEAWGGGSGGTSSANTNNHCGGGGGGGAYARRNSITVVPGISYNFNVGAGGGVGNPGIQGTQSTATINGITITAAGGGAPGNSGVPGTGGAGGLATSSVGDVTYSGGSGANGSGTGSNNGTGGGGGGGAGSTANGQNASNQTPGSSTANNGGAGGAGGVNAIGSNASNTGYGGGGGGGGHKNNAGGSGQKGAFIITYICPIITISAGTNQTLAACATSATLAGSAIPSGMTGLWTVVSGTATITTPTSPTSGVTGIPLNSTVTLRWTISNGVCGSSSNDVTITTSQGPGCLTYCTPNNTTCSAVCVPGNFACYDLISNVTLGTLNNTSGTTNCAAGGYQDFSSLAPPTLTIGLNHTIQITSGNGPGNHVAGVWIDFNQNGVLNDAGEYFEINNAIAANTTVTQTFQVPTTALLGNTRMRIRYISTSSMLSSHACNITATFGETEDYTVNIACSSLSLNTITGRFPATGLALPCGAATNLSWNAHTCATAGFDLYLGTTNPPTNLVTSTTSTSYYTGNLLGNTTYYWQLRPKDGSNIGLSDVWSFTTQTPINTAISQNVSGCSGSSICLSASGGTYPDYYWFDVPVNGIPLATGSNYCPTLTTSPTTFYVSNVFQGASSSIATSTSSGILCGTNGSSNGNMFDIQAKTANLNITAIEVMFRSLGTGGNGTRTAKVYYRQSSYVGNASNASGWNLLGSYSVTVPNSPTVTAYIDIADFFVPAGQTYGVYVVYDNDYATGANVYANVDIEVRTGSSLCGVGSEFAGEIPDRSFRGRVYYNITCSSPTIPVIATLNSVTTPTFTALGPYCQNTTPAALPSTSNNSISGTWNPSVISTSVAGIQTYNFTPTSTAAPTCATTTSMNVTINAGPSATISYSGSPWCNSAGAQSVTQTGTSGGTYSASPTGLTIDVSTGAITPSSSSAGTYTVTYTFTSGGCTNTATASVTITAAPTANAGTAATLCSGSAYTLSGSSVGGSATTGAWSITSVTGTMTNVSSQLSSTAQTSAPNTVTFTPIAGNTGSITLTLTTNDPDGVGGCSVAATTVVLTVTAPATANAGSAATLCSGSAYTLSGSSVGGSATTGAWSITSVTGTMTNNSSQLSSTAQTSTPNTITFTPTAGTTGTVTLTLTTNDPTGECPAVTSTVVLTVTAPATANAGSAATLCSGTAYTLIGSSVGGSATTGAWSITSVTGTMTNNSSQLSSTAQSSAPNTVTFTPTAGTTGTVSLTLTTNDPTGECPVVISTVVLTVNSNTTPTFTQLGPYCQNATPGTLPTTSDNSISGTWNAAISTGTVGSTSYTFTPTSTAAPTCATTATMNVSINANPTITGTLSTCINSSTELLGSGTPAITDPWTSSNTSIATVSSTGLVSGVGSGTASITYINSAGCTVSVTVTVNDILDWVNLQFPENGSICQGGTYDIYGRFYNTGDINTPDPGQAPGVTVQFGYNTANTNPSTWSNWSNANFNIQVGNNDEYMGTLNGLAPGTYFYAFRYQINSCGWQYGGYNVGGGGIWNGTTNVSGQLTVNANTTPLFSQLGPYCQNASPGTLSGTSSNGIAGSWSPTPISTSTVGNQVYTFTPSSAAFPTCATTTTMSITINPLTIPTFNSFGPYCLNDIPSSLPSPSNNGIAGSWSLSTISTSTAGSASYTFTPTSTSTPTCATGTSISVTVNQAPGIISISPP